MSKLQFNFTLVGRNGNNVYQIGGSGAYDLNDAALIANMQTIGTADETLNLGDASVNGGYVALMNLEDVGGNYFEVDSADTYDKFPQKIQPGECVILRPETATLHVKANTGAVRCAVFGCSIRAA